MGMKSRGHLAPTLSDKECAAAERLQLPSEGVRNFVVSRRGMRLCPPDCQLRAQGKTWCDTTGCRACKMHVAMVVRVVTQPACRLRVANDK